MPDTRSKKPNILVIFGNDIGYRFEDIAARQKPRLFTIDQALEKMSSAGLKTS